MKFSLMAYACLVASTTSFCQEAGIERPKAREGEFIAINSQSALSYSSDQKQTITEYKKPTITLFRSDKKGGKVKGTTFTGESGTSETQPDGRDLLKITIKGKVRAEDPDGTITTADEAVIDLLKGIYTYTGKSIRIVTAGK